MLFSASDLTISTANVATGGDQHNPPVAMRNEMVVNHALAALLETTIRSFVTTGVNHTKRVDTSNAVHN